MIEILSHICLFCKVNGLSETRFGELALNDKPFVSQLRSGRRIWPETERKVRQFMATYVPSAAKAATPESAEKAA